MVFIMTALSWEAYEGRNVLVRMAGDRHNPAVAARGMLHFRPKGERTGKARAPLVVDFPDMFTSPAHQRVFELDDAAVGRFLAGGSEGVLEWTVDANLEAETRDKTSVAPDARQPK